MNLLFAAVFVFLCHAVGADVKYGFWQIEPFSNSINRVSRIVGGDEVVRHTHPYQAGLLMRYASSTGLCGGSLINRRTVLSAAHCPEGSLSTQVILGAHSITTVEATQIRQTVEPSEYRIHPNYNIPVRLANDVAILILPLAVDYNEFIQAIALPSGDLANSLFVNEIATISGWGRTDAGTTSTVLRSTSNPVITNAACASVFGSATIQTSTICVSTAGGRSSCNGDSGGPLTVTTELGVVLIGAASFVASGGCDRGVPAGYARVTSFLTWIEQNSVE